MLTTDDKEYVLNLVKELTPDILKHINFNPDIKEVGQSYHGPFEDELVARLIALDNDFSEPQATRSMADVLYKGHFINIKFGYKKKGQPNVCAGNRLFNYFAGKGGKNKNEKIDSYYLLSVDADGLEYMLFNVCDYLDYMTYNAGPGQWMVQEIKLKKVYVFNDLTLDKLSESNVLNKIVDRMEDSANSTHHLRMKKVKEMQILKICN